MTDPKRLWLAPVVGGLLGFLFFAAVLDLQVVDPRRIDWLLVGDRQVNLLGWHAFAREAWHLPPGRIAGLRFPLGTSIGLTDGIPLLALPAKLLPVGLFGDFQYFGLWLLASFVLQGVFGALLVRSFTDNVAAALAGSALFVLSPILLARTGHLALTAHWLLLAALYLNLRALVGPHPTDSWPWLLLCTAAALVHPYMAVMVFGLGLSATARAVLTGRSSFTSGILRLLGWTPSMGAAFWIGGYFVAESTESLAAGGLGYYSMNLLSPLDPAGWSSLLPLEVATATEGQYEGFNYLGAGVLGLAVVVLGWPGRGRPLRLPRIDQLPLLLVCTGFTLVALSPSVTVADRVVANYDGPLWTLVGPFRATGRFFWPANYLLLFLIIATAWRRLPARGAVWACWIAVAVQAVDLSGMHRTFQLIPDAPSRYVLHDPIWRVAAPHYEHLVMVTPNMCGGHDPEFLPYAYFAAAWGLTINDGAAARPDVGELARYCQGLAATVGRGQVDDASMYVLSHTAAADFRRRAMPSTVCSPADLVMLCVTAKSYVSWGTAAHMDYRTTPGRAESDRFREVLELKYRTDLRRVPGPARLDPSIATEYVGRYLGLRLNGCGHEIATTKVVALLDGEPVLPICLEGLGRLPRIERQETFDFRTRFEQRILASRPPWDGTTAVDPEGEAVWLQEYVTARVRGCSEEEAQQIVLAQIDARALPSSCGA